MKNKAVVEMEKMFLALGDETRLRLLNIMREREVNVNAFVEITGESQPKISRHLAVLRNAGIVELRRDGKRIHYKIAAPTDDFAALILSDALKWMNSRDEIRRESDKFAAQQIPAEEFQTSKGSASQLNAPVKANAPKNRELEIYLL